MSKTFCKYKQYCNILSPNQTKQRIFLYMKPLKGIQCVYKHIVNLKRSVNPFLAPPIPFFCVNSFLRVIYFLNRREPQSINCKPIDIQTLGRTNFFYKVADNHALICDVQIIHRTVNQNLSNLQNETKSGQLIFISQTIFYDFNDFERCWTSLDDVGRFWTTLEDFRIICHYPTQIRHYSSLFRHYLILFPHYLTLFDTIRHYSTLFRHYSTLFDKKCSPSKTKRGSRKKTHKQYSSFTLKRARPPWLGCSILERVHGSMGAWVQGSMGLGVDRQRGARVDGGPWITLLQGWTGAGVQGWMGGLMNDGRKDSKRAQKEARRE